jgi:hypothetical protein
MVRLLVGIRLDSSTLVLELSYRFVQHLATFLPLPYAGPKDGFQLAKYLFLNANDNEQIKIEPIKKPIDDM